MKRGRGARTRPDTIADDAFASASRELNAVRDNLLAQRAQFDQKIAAIEDAIRQVGGTVAGGAASPARGGGRGGRGRRGRRPAGGAAGGFRAGSLKDYVTAALGKGDVMGIGEIEQGVRTAGYKTKNKTLAKSIGIALAQMPNVKRVGRGQYRLK